MNALMKHFGDLRRRLRIDEWDDSRKLIVLSAAGLFVLMLWGSIARIDEITRGLGKVVPSSKAQLVQAAAPATVTAILVRPGQLVRKGQLLVSLDDSQSASALGQLEAENSRLEARASRLEQEERGEPRLHGRDCLRRGSPPSSSSTGNRAKPRECTCGGSRTAAA